MLRTTYLFILLLLIFKNSPAQLTVSDSLSSETLVKKVLTGGGIKIFNVKYKGAKVAIGNFNGTKSNIGLKGGVLLTTGSIYNAPGPNKNAQTTKANALDGDWDLDSLSGGAQTQDATALEFDFIPSTDTLSFRYVFASEEYPKYVCKQFNDIFGFFISGPGITGKKNIALIPNTNTPVSINNVNNGNPNDPTCVPQNTQYYMDNSGGATVEYNGFTTVLTATAIVEPCKTYHIKLVIADVEDDKFDSGVFLEAGSFSSTGTIDVKVESPTNDTVAVEGCNTMNVRFIRTFGLSSEKVIHFSIEGTAQNGIDYRAIADSVVVPAGDSTAIVVIDPLPDSDNDSEEIVRLVIKDEVSSTCIATSTIDVIIREALPINIKEITDTIICIGAVVPVKPEITGGYRPVSYTLNGEFMNDSLLLLSPTATTTYVLKVAEGCSNQEKSESFIINVNPLPVATFSVTSAECSSVVSFRATNQQISGAKYLWKFGDHETAEGIEVAHAYSEAGMYAATLILQFPGACVDSISHTVDFTAETIARIYIPNSFSPNGDGHNDQFTIENASPRCRLKRLSIFNRWGEKVYESSYSPDGNYWDGTTNSREAHPGVYAYFIEVDGNTIKGLLTVTK